MEEIYGKAVQEKTWTSLLAYPSLLFRWQVHHPEDIKRIATVASHTLGKHHFCETNEKCFTVEEFLNKYGIKTV